MFCGPFSNEWERILHHVNAWMRELQPVKCLRVPAHSDPVASLSWISARELKSSPRVDDVAAKLAQWPRSGMPKKLSADTRHFLRERLRVVHPILEAISGSSRQAQEPTPLFAVHRYEGLESQQIGWALVAYWHEFGRNRWYMEQLGSLFYAASVNGWKPKESSS